MRHAFRSSSFRRMAIAAAFLRRTLGPLQSVFEKFLKAHVGHPRTLASPMPRHAKLPRSIFRCRRNRPPVVLGTRRLRPAPPTFLRTWVEDPAGLGRLIAKPRYVPRDVLLNYAS